MRKVAQTTKDSKGAAAGKLDKKKSPSYVGTLVNQNKFRTGFHNKSNGYKSNTLTSNLAPSNIIDIMINLIEI